MAFPYIKSSLVEVTSILKSNYRVFFKNELEQPSGSFKLKGIGFLVGKSIDQAKTLKKTGVEVFSSSGGNAGLAAAHSAKYYQVPCTVVLPKTSKLIVIKKLEELNAKVIVEGNHWGEADEYLRKSVIGGLPESIYPVYVHPFDNPVIWEGHGIFIDELKDQMSPLELSKIRAVVCSVGGGGLYNGVVRGLERNSDVITNSPVVVAVETAQAPTFSEAIKAGRLVKLDKVSTVANSLASPYISEQSLVNYKNYKTNLELIDDLDALKGTLEYYDNFNGGTVEPACGAAISTVTNRKDLLDKLDLQKDDIVVVIVCGGLGISEEIIEEYREKVK